ARKGDVEGVESDGEGGFERVESIGEGNLGGVQADGEGVCATGIEVDECDGVEMDNVAAASSGEEDDRNEIEVWDLDEHGSLVGSDEDEEHENDERRRTPCCLRMANCPWRIRASYIFVVKCLEIKMFQDEHHYSVSFKNKMVTAAMVTQHFEATIKDHPKMKLREIQRRCPSEIHIVKCTTKREWEDLCLALKKKDKYSCNNLCEAFNSSIVEARFKSIIRMLEDIRTKMTRIVQKRKLCDGWKQNYGPFVKAKFDANKKDCIEWQLIWNGENGCELEERKLSICSGPKLKDM
ncbi:hypothetical protein Gotur_006494, partial [Gossypium turneri]